MDELWADIELKIKAGYPYFYFQTHEENRVAAFLGRIAKKLDMKLIRWSAYKGFSEKLQNSADPLETVSGFDAPALFLLQDFHKNLSDPRTIRQFKDNREALIKGKKAVVITAPALALPVELEKLFTLVVPPLPSIKELKILFANLAKARSIEIKQDVSESFARAAGGLTAEEAMLAFTRVMLEKNAIETGDTSVIVEEKRRLVESEGVLEFYERNFSLSNVGGLHTLKQWLKERDDAFDEGARAFGLPEPKGLLLLGVQGCGKSLTAKAVAKHWGLPLLRFDLAAAVSRTTSPEETIRTSMRLMEAMSPVVVWIDELEKGFAGAKGQGDPSILRVLGAFITWLQEKRKPVFVVATANDIQSLPPELLRKGRFDEIFFVDLPDAHERAEILDIHFNNRGVSKESIGKMEELVAITKNFAGSELEQVVIDGMYRAYAQKRTPNPEDFRKVAESFQPLYNTYEEDIKRLRDWAQSRARRASIDSSMTDYFQTED